MRILVIPDTQISPGSPTRHLEYAGMYAVDKKPDVIVDLGDHWDLDSIGVYDIGTTKGEGQRYALDIEAGVKAMKVFLRPIWDDQERARKHKKTIWKPRMVFTLGNHEDRITRLLEKDPKLNGFISLDDLELESMGWEVYDFKDPVFIEDVGFCHYFVSGQMGRPCCSARSMLMKKHMSCIMGHVQDRDIAEAKRADGKRLTCLFAGIFYDEDKAYLNPQTNTSWSGIWMLNEVERGSFDLLPISLNYLERKYGGYK